ncbi:MAG: hypothetical protein KF773_02305 [Deltaproteobacteria bacterium]|nr:hypothetical protein [Deltaproteobacteria bacterium]
MERRDFLWLLGGLTLGCSTGPSGDPDAASGAPSGDGSTTAPSDAAPDACVVGTVTMHDTYAQALYLDGSYGPLTGTITTQMVSAGAAVTLAFWHGHGGVDHRFTLEPAHLARLRAGEKVTLGTTTVDGHAHTLFIDPRDERYRVPGAPDVAVPLDHCT